MKIIMSHKVRLAHILHLTMWSLSLILIAFSVFRLSQSKVNAAPASGSNYVTEEDINDPNKTQQTLKVLIIEINPHLNSLAGSPKALDVTHYAGVEHDAVEDRMDDLEVGSKGYFDVQIADWLYLDEFPTYTGGVTREDGTHAHSLDEQSYLTALGYYEDGSFDWHRAIVDGEIGKYIDDGLDWNFTFDYDYIIDKFDLTSRYEAGDFDEVWLTAIDPLLAYETTMIGNNAYFVNSDPIVMDSAEFIISSIAPSRRDSNIHALDHMYESVLDGVYGGAGYDYYAENAILVSTIEEYQALNDLGRFMLNNYANSGSLNGVGTVHCPWNARYDYDYENEILASTMQTNWQGTDLSDQPTEITNSASDTWLEADINSTIELEQRHPDRLWQRYWLYSMPAQTGYTEYGYLKNWFKYFYSKNYITSLKAKQEELELSQGEAVDLEYYAYYKFGQTEFDKVKPGENTTVSDSSIVGYKNGQWVALKEGATSIKYWRDGKAIEYQLTVSAAKHDMITPIIKLSSEEYAPGSWSKQNVNVKVSNTANNFLPVTYYVSTNGGEFTKISAGQNNLVEQEGEITLSYKAISEGGAESAPVSIQIKIDKTAPSLKIASGEKVWQKFSPVADFNIVEDKTKSFIFTIADAVSGIQSAKYLISSTPFKTVEEAASVSGWQTVPESAEISVKPNRDFVLYLMSTDKAGNTAIINSDGVRLESAAAIEPTDDNGAADSNNSSDKENSDGENKNNANEPDKDKTNPSESDSKTSENDIKTSSSTSAAAQPLATEDIDVKLARNELKTPDTGTYSKLVSSAAASNYSYYLLILAAAGYILTDTLRMLRRKIRYSSFNKLR